MREIPFDGTADKGLQPIAAIRLAQLDRFRQLIESSVELEELRFQLKQMEAQNRKRAKSLADGRHHG